MPDLGRNFGVQTTFHCVQRLWKSSSVSRPRSGGFAALLAFEVPSCHHADDTSDRYGLDAKRWEGPLPLNFASFDDRRNYRLAMLAVLLLALGMRIAFAVAFSLQSGALPDADSYREAASDLLAGRLISDDVMMPGYPLLLALSGTGVGQVIADILLSVLSVWCVAEVTRAITGDAFAAMIAAALWAVYPFSLFYAAVGLTETLFVTLVLLAYLAFFHGAFVLGSVAIVAAILTRPSIEVLAPLLVIAFALIVHRSNWRRALMQLGVYFAIYVVMMSPWWWHNTTKYGEFVRLNLASGVMLYAGNNPMNTTGGGRGETDYDHTKFEHIENPVARDRAFRKASIDFMIDNPKRAVELMWLKFLRIWRPWPYASEFSRPIFVFVSMATMLPLMLFASLGLVFGIRRRWRPLVPVVMFIGFMTAVHMLTVGSIRYRFSMEPFLVVLAAPAVAGLFRRLASSAIPSIR